MRHWICSIILTMSIAAAAQETPLPAIGLRNEVHFAGTSPLSGNEEIARRFLSPLVLAQLRQGMARTGQAFRAQAINPAEEEFILYVPPHPPADGYRLLVFVPPWQQAKLPFGWEAVLDRFGIIYVSAARSGNPEIVIDRRVPLALIAAYNVMQAYRVDPAGVFVGGFSGGSRVAMRIAIAYPDLFRGALLFAGSDAIGDSAVPLPPRELFLAAQQSTKLIFLTGQNDTANLTKDDETLGAMREWCLFGTARRNLPWRGHEIAKAGELAQGVELLLSAPKPDDAELSACRARLDAELDERIRLQTPRDAIDRRFSGWASTVPLSAPSQ